MKMCDYEIFFYRAIDDRARMGHVLRRIPDGMLYFHAFRTRRAAEEAFPYLSSASRFWVKTIQEVSFSLHSSLLSSLERT